MPMANPEGGFNLDDNQPSDDFNLDDNNPQQPNGNDKPFDDEPFDAGVETSEDEDPKKFIQQLSGKLGQSLRKYTKNQGQPDFELEKFAVNSVLSATHTSQMDSDDQNDIIKKVKSSGNNNDLNNSNNNQNDNQDNIQSNDEMNGNELEGGDNSMGQNDVEESVKNNFFNENLIKSKKSGIFEGKNLKNIIMKKISENFDIDTTIDEIFGNTEAPITKPEKEIETKPKTDEPGKKTRRERTWKPNPGESPQPKAQEE